MIRKPATHVTLAAVAILILGVGLAGAQDAITGAEGRHGVREHHQYQSQTSYGDHHNGGDRTIAAAALEPVEGVTGWGRVVVMDVATEEGTDRVVTVHLYGLKANTMYEVAADDTPLGTPETDDGGDAWFRLATNDENAPPPENLPPADELFRADVFEIVAGSAPVLSLSGEFKTMIQGGGGNPLLTFMERITLEPVDDLADHGMARVEIDEDGEQRFQTAACGLVPGDVYDVMADVGSETVQAGSVTADPFGHACLILATDSTSDPLPGGLDPVNEITKVAWKTTGANSVTVLEGTFSGDNMVGGNGGPNGGDGGDGGPGNGDGDCDGGNGDGDGDGDCDGGGGSGGGSGGNGGGGRP